MTFKIFSSKWKGAATFNSNTFDAFGDLDEIDTQILVRFMIQNGKVYRYVNKFSMQMGIY